MDEIELLRLQDEALSYLRDNITKDEAYYILTTDKDIIEILIADKKDGSKRIKILDMEYTVENIMRARRTVKERDIVKILVFGYDRTLIKSIKDSGFRSMSDVISYANNMVGDKPIDHIRVSNEARGWCGSYTNYGKRID